MTNQNVAYYSSVTEFESGWGQRPDGYLVALTKEAFFIHAKEINIQQGHEYSRVDYTTPKLCLITDSFLNYLVEENFKSIWTWRGLKDWLVEG